MCPQWRNPYTLVYLYSAIPCNARGDGSRARTHRVVQFFLSVCRPILLGTAAAATAAAAPARTFAFAMSDESTPPTEMQSQKRKASQAGLDGHVQTRSVKRRASKACQCCRARKVRCNVTEHGAPCTNCRLDEVDCIVSESRRKKSVTCYATPHSLPVSPLHAGLSLSLATETRNIFSAHILFVNLSEGDPVFSYRGTYR